MIEETFPNTKSFPEDLSSFENVGGMNLLENFYAGNAGAGFMVQMKGKKKKK